MDFIDFLLEEKLFENNLSALANPINNYKKAKEKAKGKKDTEDKNEDSLGLVKDPDDETGQVKATRYKFNWFMVQPPINYKKKSQEERIEVYSKIQKTLALLKESADAINSKGFIQIWKPREEDKSLTVVRLVDDHDDKYSAMYQQEDDDKDGQWEHGDFILNISAKNMNIHTIVHEMGHKVYYEMLNNEQAERWRSYYRARKYRDKKEFVTKYAMDNYREDFAETFSVYILGVSKINDLYDKNKVNRDEDLVIKILKTFKELIFGDEKKKK